MTLVMRGEIRLIKGVVRIWKHLDVDVHVVIWMYAFEQVRAGWL